jgi:hypothetical protein
MIIHRIRLVYSLMPLYQRRADDLLGMIRERPDSVLRIPDKRVRADAEECYADHLTAIVNLRGARITYIRLTKVVHDTVLPQESRYLSIAVLARRTTDDKPVICVERHLTVCTPPGVIARYRDMPSIRAALIEMGGWATQTAAIIAETGSCYLSCIKAKIIVAGCKRHGQDVPPPNSTFADSATDGVYHLAWPSRKTIVEPPVCRVQKPLFGEYQPSSDDPLE